MDEELNEELDEELDDVLDEALDDELESSDEFDLADIFMDLLRASNAVSLVLSTDTLSSTTRLTSSVGTSERALFGFFLFHDFLNAFLFPLVTQYLLCYKQLHCLHHQEEGPQSHHKFIDKTNRPKVERYAKISLSHIHRNTNNVNKQVRIKLF